MVPYELVAPNWRYSTRLALVAGQSLVTSTLLFSLRNLLPPGSRRLFPALLAIIVYFVVPALFHPDDEICTLAVLGLNFMWLGSAKALGWALGRGPLTEDLTLPQFIAVMTLPITPVLAAQPSKKSNARQIEAGDGFLLGVIDVVAKVVALGVTLTALQSKDLHRLAKEVLYAIGLYLFMGIIMSFVGAACVGILNLRVAVHFDRPFLSQSLTDYWSRRWNLNTGYTLRFLVYDPICEGRLVKNEKSFVKGPLKPPTRMRRAVAAVAAFVFSGIMHEIFIIYLRGRISGQWFAFFSIQGPLVVAEGFLRQALRVRGLTVPKYIANPLTLAFLLFLGDLLFFPDIEGLGIPQQVVTNLYMLMQTTTGMP